MRYHGFICKLKQLEMSISNTVMFIEEQIISKYFQSIIILVHNYSACIASAQLRQITKQTNKQH